MNTVLLRKDAVTEYEIPIWTVLHLTDPATGHRPVVLGRSSWFNEAEAQDHAREQSVCYPAPQRFSVYTPDSGFVCGFQCGQVQRAFVIA